MGHERISRSSQSGRFAWRALGVGFIGAAAVFDGLLINQAIESRQDAVQTNQVILEQGSTPDLQQRVADDNKRMALDIACVALGTATFPAIGVSIYRSARERP